MDLDELTQALGLGRSELRAVFRVGSRVYGSAGPGSDEDFVVVLARPDAKRDLLFGPGVNAITHTAASFQQSLDEQSLIALEAWFAPPAHRLLEPRPAFRFELRRPRLVASAVERSRSDYAKAQKRFEDEPGPSQKRVFHALRGPMFALQIARQGKLADFTEATPLLSELRALDRWEDIEGRFGPLHRGLLGELEAAASKARR